ncbi:sterol desaturase family protein [Labrys monachus]|uniref:Sterol desaturase/sphingolipid hydroxylase (Fatty acid hydroxylase superfamily) n=1 Tax=Labrys monachus TaxID=217067 RepID=A0ABU0FCB4_9HYPH|nr:sterol desaturase family protein [Labrys monachus]MDQ0392258.1 sterol desaturase/sphingolipid hydroxylase (fatty acid hydroxylase superfamily) [Labrys monachus]
MNLNRFLYFGDFIACPLAIAGLLLAVLAQGDLTALGMWCLAFVAGCMAWTLVEYAVHRWVYHAVPYFDKMHDAHHQEPKGMIGAPSFFSVALIFAIFYLPLYFASHVFAGGFTSGILLGYTAYMLVHHASHHWALKPGGLLYRLRLKHMVHHFRGEEGNYGVITSFWDHVFATYIEPQRRRAS